MVEAQTLRIKRTEELRRRRRKRRKVALFDLTIPLKKLFTRYRRRSIVPRSACPRPMKTQRPTSQRTNHRAKEQNLR